MRQGVATHHQGQGDQDLSEDEDICSVLLETTSALGLTGIEVKLGKDDLISRAMREWLREKLRSYGFKPYAHLPYLQGDINLAHPDPKLAGKACEVIRESIHFATDIGCILLNTHLGVRLGEGPHISSAIGRLMPIMEESRGLGVEISIENQESTCNGILNVVEDIEALLDIGPDLPLTYDAGHGNTHGLGIGEFLPRVLPNLRYLHLHDNRGSKDEHLALGKGNLEFGLLLSQFSKHEASLPPEMPLTLELNEGDLGPSVAYIRPLARGGLSFI
jgi:sugar phosphate isomerase/epimerase